LNFEATQAVQPTMLSFDRSMMH